MTSRLAPLLRLVMCVAALSLLLSVASWPFGHVPSATAQAGDYQLAVSSAIIVEGESDDVRLTVTPGDVEPAAIGGQIIYDDSVLTATACEALVAVSACNIDTPGTIRFQALDPFGWLEPTDLISVTFENTGLQQGETQVDVSVADSVDADIEPAVADVIAGTVSTITHGDVNCDGQVNIVDALLIAQFDVGNRTGTTQCPLEDPLTQVLESTIDVNCDDELNIVDALFISQYNVGNRSAETQCPLSDPATTIYLGP